MDFLWKLFDTTDFPARWHCGNWSEPLGWTYIFANLAIWGAYFAIPIVLGYFVLKRRDIPFRRLMVLFVAFILLCGTTHLIDAIIFWWPAYRFSALILVLTGAVSWTTVFALMRVAPQVLVMRSPLELEREIQERTEALEESQAMFEELADKMSQLAWMADPSGHVFWYNHRWFEFTGTTLEEMQGWGWKKVQHPDHLDRVLEKWSEHIAKGEPWEDLFPLRRADGEYRWFLSRARPFRNESGVIVRWIGTNTDVTEQREDARRKDEFLATLAHELRNPLAPIRSGLELLKRIDCQNPELVAEVRATMERQAMHLIAMVDDLLDVSRITRGKLELRKCKTNLQDVVRGAVDATAELFEKNQHNLTIELPEEKREFDADPTRITQVLANLLSNAAKYTPPGGDVVLRAAYTNGDVVISVRDNGIGIPSEKLDQIFEMFTQVDHSVNKGNTGLGIGLTLVKSLVAMHNGDIEVESQVSQGSEFKVRLPVHTTLPECGTEPPQIEEGQLK